MADIKTPTQVAQDYLDELKSLKPSLNTDQTDSDWWIRSRVIGGVVAGIYADNRSISNDPFPQSARHDALRKLLFTYFDAEGTGDFLPATTSQGSVSVSGNPGQVLSQGLQAIYLPNGNTYSVQETTTLDAVVGTGLVPFESIGTGQAQNLTASAILNFPSPPSGLNSIAIVASGGMADARDPESDTEARARILVRIRLPLSVGRVSDYEQYAKLADPSVVSASVSRFPYGLGTVGVYITSGTTDIDAAVDNGDAISVIPSDQLVETVQAFLEVNRPVTDCVTVFKPVAVAINVTVTVKYAQGTGSTILSGQNLTQDQLVIREVSRALYKTPVGGRILGTSGYVVSSEIEETIDLKLSAGPVVEGSIPILLDRQVSPLTVTGANRSLVANETPIPGTITVIS